MPILRWQSRVPYDPATVHPQPNLERRLGSQECRVRWSAQLTKIAFHLLFVMLMSGAIQAQTTPASPVSGNKSVNGNAAASSTNSQDKTTGVAAVTASPDTDQHLALLH